MHALPEQNRGARGAGQGACTRLHPRAAPLCTPVGRPGAGLLARHRRRAGRAPHAQLQQGPRVAHAAGAGEGGVRHGARPRTVAAS